jgi:hypothetical protein
MAEYFKILENFYRPKNSQSQFSESVANNSDSSKVSSKNNYNKDISSNEELDKSPSYSGNENISDQNLLDNSSSRYLDKNNEDNAKNDQENINYNNSQKDNNLSDNNLSDKSGNASDGTTEKKTFAERYQKKPTFTSSNLELESDKDSRFDIQSKSANPPKKVDPQKKMLASQIYLVKGVDRGRNAWYYVLVDRLKVKLFLKALNDDIIHLENYGKILYSAYGDEPPKEITDALKDEYGIDG